MLLELDKTASGELSENDLHHCISSRYSIYLLYCYKSANTNVFGFLVICTNSDPQIFLSVCVFVLSNTYIYHMKVCDVGV